MSAPVYIVALSDDEQGYHDQDFFGPFRSRDKAEGFAEKLRKRIQAEDQIYAWVRMVQPPLLRNVDPGWFEEGGTY